VGAECAAGPTADSLRRAGAPPDDVGGVALITPTGTRSGEAMSSVSEGSRQLLIGTGKHPSGGVLVAVRDSGPGLSPESFERLFDAFYTTKPGGMGMGLSICRSIVEAHGRRIWVSRDVGPGATFQFTLPLPSAPQA
jgi:signal transduction histidine kinase